MSWAGISLSPELNSGAPDDRISDIRAAGAGVAVLTIPTEEELIIYIAGARLRGVPEGSHVVV